MKNNQFIPSEWLILSVQQSIYIGELKPVLSVCELRFLDGIKCKG